MRINSSSLHRWFFKQIRPLTTWYKKRQPREQRLVLGAAGVALFIGLFTFVESVVTVFADQAKRHDELVTSLERIPPLLHRYNALKQKKQLLDQRFQGTDVQQTANYAHLEKLIKRKAQITSRFEIRRGSESQVQDEYTLVPFTVRFQQMTTEELSNFLKELSADEERPSIISRLSVRTRGQKISVELSLDFVSRVGSA